MGMEKCEQMRTNRKNVDKAVEQIINDALSGRQNVTYLLNSTELSEKEYTLVVRSNFANQFVNLDSEVEEQKDYYEAALSREKHIRKIVLLLEKDGATSHNELARKAGIFKSQLTRAIAAIGPFGFIAFERQGNSKKYALTQKGHAFADYLAKAVVQEDTSPVQSGGAVLKRARVS